MNTTASVVSPKVPSSDTRKVFLHTFGCQMNVLDSELMLGKLQHRGWRTTEIPREADVILYNTCAVRELAEHKLLSMVGEHGLLKKTNPSLMIGVLGCMSQLRGEELARLSSHVDFIVGTDHMDRIDEIIEEAAASSSLVSHLSRRDRMDYERDVTVRPSRASAYVNVMRGCDLHCTYCVVPTTRGKERSRTMPDILDEVRALVDDGCTEITYLGQTVNAYGRKDGVGTFAQLLRSTQEIPNLRRIRFVTSHPRFMTDDLIDAMAECDKVCPALPLPPQSGSDAVLKRMKRQYTRGEYLDIIGRLKSRIPGISLTGDFIVGFCGETEQDFRQTESLMLDVQFQTAYIFKYSVRDGTFAAGKLGDDVPWEVKRERNQRLLDLQMGVMEKLNRGRIGQRVDVLLEREDKRHGVVMGRDAHHLNIAVKTTPDLIGSYLPCLITSTTPLTLTAEPILQGAIHA